MWSLIELDAIKSLIDPHSQHRIALEKFCEDRMNARRKDCAQAMQSVPRAWEQAADYAAKSEVYENLIADLEREFLKATERIRR